MSARRRHFGFAWRDGLHDRMHACVWRTRFQTSMSQRREKKGISLRVPSSTYVIIIIIAICLYVYKLPLWRNACVAVPMAQLFLSLFLSPLSLLLIFLSPLPSLLRCANPPFNRISRSPSAPSALSPLSCFFLPLAIIRATNYGGYMGWGDILFVCVRTCQNGIVDVSRRIDIPGMVFIRVTGYAELCVTMRVSTSGLRPACLPLLLPLFTVPRSKTHFYSLSPSPSPSPLRSVSSPSVIKGVPDMESFFIRRIRVSK